MEKEYFKKISITTILIVLLVLSYFLLKPILISILIGLILAFLFNPLFEWINKYTKNKSSSAFLICLLLILIIALILWYFVPIMINQSIRLYNSALTIDFVAILQNIFPSLFESETLSNEIGPIINSFVTDATNSLVKSFSSLILNLPKIFLHLLVILFTFFFTLRDRDKLISYIQSLLPFSKDVERKLFKSSKDITRSVLYGRVLLGIAQGIIVGIGFFIFKVPNALLLTALAALAGIVPIIGTIVVWAPVAIFAFIAGNPFMAWGVIIFGLIANVFESIVQPIVLSKMIKMNSSVALIGMIGGVFLFGVLGIILGPLILAYLLIILEIYRNKKSQNFLVEN